MNPITDGATDPLRSYSPGTELTKEWYRAVIRPAVPAGNTPQRVGDSLALQIPEHAMGEGTTALRSYPWETTMQLRQNGVLLHEDDAAWGQYLVGDGTVQLDLSVVKENDPDWQFSTRTDTTWTFDSVGEGSATTSVLPLLRLDYDVPVDLENRVSAGATLPIGLQVRHPEQWPHRTSVTSARVWVSYDEGDTWQEAAVHHEGPSRASGNFIAMVDHPQEADTVSLRVETGDSYGNSIEQTIVRAYGIGSD